MTRDVSDATLVTSRNDLVAWLEKGCKPSSELRLGTEHEKLVFFKNNLRPVPYQETPYSNSGQPPGSIQGLLTALKDLTQWEGLYDHEHLIGLYESQTKSAISLEPAGQFELSGAPLRTVHETAQELDTHLAQVKQVAEPYGIAFLGTGMSPLWTLDETPVMPKSRYEIMARYMPKVGSRGLDMMFRTMTVQVNLDYLNEADMVKKLRVSVALQPLITALFANSPFTEGQPNGALSERSLIWEKTDPARTGMIPFIFEEGMGFERWVDYALEVPMYFVKRDAHYYDVAGHKFDDLMQGRLASLPHEQAILSDWANHLSTLFPEVRLKQILEIRGADAGSREHMLALPALCVGLLYDSDVLDAAWNLVKSWTTQERQRLREEAPLYGLKTRLRERSLQEWGGEILKLAEEGLKRRHYLNAQGQDETLYLDILKQRLESGRVAADDLLTLFHHEWKGDIRPLFEEARL